MAVLSAGTADEGVAEECRLIADFMGCYTFRLPDVSVDGLHRILHNLPGACSQWQPVWYALACIHSSQLKDPFPELCMVCILVTPASSVMDMPLLDINALYARNS